MLGRVQPDGAHPSSGCKLPTAKIDDYYMSRLGHKHMAVDSKEFFPPWPLTSAKKTSTL